jgi:hypothetical protein
VLPIKEIGYGLLPTPIGNDALKNGDLTQNPNNGLSNYVRYGLLPTPRVSGQEGYETRVQRKGHKAAMSYLESALEFHLMGNAMLNTPCARDYKGSRSTEALEASGRKKTNTLPDRFAQPGKTSQLNPRFVAEMMGFPVNWTELPFRSGVTNP